MSAAFHQRHHMHHHHHPHQLPIDASTPDRIELSEAECDIDTLKKLKLGMRSTLWSRPTVPTGAGGDDGGLQQQQQATGNPSDYSIAV